ncbi:MAG: GTP pyrophosphokinase family protein [Clostridia bacterium]|nr:GTP pyrophosphokinase family protein [Clostridia bacterium]
MRTLTTEEKEGVLKEIAPYAEQYMRTMSYFRCAMMEVETKFRVISEDFSYRHDRNPIETVKSRLKSPESIRQKLIKKNGEFTVENIEKSIFDVAGVRVICSFLDDVYSLAESFLGQDDVRLIEIKDYIKNPKPNGYRSLHLIIEIPIFLFDEKRHMKVEIQMRTIAMDFWASLDHHMRYKKDGAVITDKTREELLRCATLSAELDGSMNELRHEILGE